MITHHAVKDFARRLNFEVIQVNPLNFDALVLQRFHTVVRATGKRQL